MPPDTRVGPARYVIAGVLGLDALTTVLIGLAEAKPNPTARLQLGAVLWGLIVGAPFLLVLVRFWRAPGLTRAATAVTLAWITGMGLPFAFLLLTALSWGSAPDRNRWVPLQVCLTVTLVQMTIPAARRWARTSETFLSAYGRTAGLALLIMALLGGWIAIRI